MPDPQVWAREVRTRLPSLRLSPTREAEIVDEPHWRELTAGGASPEKATRLAVADFRSGNVLAQYLAPLRQANAATSITPAAPTRHVIAALWLTCATQGAPRAPRTL